MHLSYVILIILMRLSAGLHHPPYRQHHLIRGLVHFRQHHRLDEVALPVLALFVFAFIVCFFSSAFLVGPIKQVKNMCHEKRRIASIVYFLAIVFTLVVAFAVSIIFNSIPDADC